MFLPWLGQPGGAAWLAVPGASLRWQPQVGTALLEPGVSGACDPGATTRRVSWGSAGTDGL